MTAPLFLLAMTCFLWPLPASLPLLYRNVGAHELLRNESAAGALHDSEYSGRRVRNYCCVRDRYADSIQALSTSWDYPADGLLTA